MSALVPLPEDVAEALQSKQEASDPLKLRAAAERLVEILREKFDKGFKLIGHRNNNGLIHHYERGYRIEGVPLTRERENLGSIVAFQTSLPEDLMQQIEELAEKDGLSLAFQFRRKTGVVMSTGILPYSGTKTTQVIIYEATEKTFDTD